MGKRLHDGIRGIIRSGRAPVARTNEQFVRDRRGKRDNKNGDSFWHIGLGQFVSGREDYKRKLAAANAVECA